ncbi:MAG: sigma-70 family RNA polymerase sigma factor [Planctomycetota bacterium]
MGGDPICERSLVKAVLAGNRDAEARFLARMVCLPRFIQTLQSSARHNEHLLEELTQETFRRVWAQLAHYRGEASLEVWAYGVARRTILEFARLDRRHSDHLVNDFARLESAIDPQTDPESAPEPPAEQEAILAAYDRLPADLRALVHARVVEEVPYAELARINGEPVANVRQRYARAVRQIRESAARARKESDT